VCDSHVSNIQSYHGNIEYFDVSPLNLH